MGLPLNRGEAAGRRQDEATVEMQVSLLFAPLTPTHSGQEYASDPQTFAKETAGRKLQLRVGVRTDRCDVLAATGSSYP